MTDAASVDSPAADASSDARGAAVSEAPVRVRYAREGERLVREIETSIGESRYEMKIRDVPRDVPWGKAWSLARMRGVVPRPERRPRRRIRTVDLFSGSGGMALGANWAIEAVGRRPTPLLAVDVDPEALDVHEYNHLPRKTYPGSVRDLFAAAELTAADDPSTIAPERILAPGAEWLATLGEADLVFGGPPCQGHSNLNNRTRRTDDRNQLYLWMALAAGAFRAKAVVIENVASVKADAGDVVGKTLDLLERMGYRIVFDAVLSADRMGVAQTRRRHFLIAVRSDVVSPRAEAAAEWLRELRVAPLDVMDAIGDLEDATTDDDYDKPSVLSEENQRRIDYLFRENVHDLPPSERPLSHRDGHTYPSVYGRMKKDEPAQTLSTGFLSPGRGRYVHPTRRRTMTLHEGARVQGFPDDFAFVRASGEAPRRTSVARMIGDAVPPPMAFHVVLAALASLRSDAFGGK